MTRTSPDQNALLEFLEAKVLQQLFTQDLQGRLVLKGGLAMRAIYGSQRMTQDIDLNADASVSGQSLGKSVGKAIEASMAELRRAGLLKSHSVTTPKQTETTYRWKVHARMNNGSDVHFKVEVSRRKVESMPAIELNSQPVRYGAIEVAPVPVVVTPPAQMALGKLAALMADGRDKPRDLFDLHILISTQVEPSPALREWLDRRMAETGESLEDVIESLWAKVESMTYDRARDEVLDYIDPALAERFDETYWGQLQLEVAQRAEAWLRAAGEDPGPAENEGGLSP